MFLSKFTIHICLGYALDPSVDADQVAAASYIGAVEEAEKSKGNTFFFDHVDESFRLRSIINMTHTIFLHIALG